MKVLLLSDFFLSGQTTHVLELAYQLERLGINVHIAFGTIHSKLFWSHYAPHLTKRGISFSEEANLAVLLPKARRWQPDLLHSQSSTLFQRAQLLSSRLDVPYVVTCHGLGFHQTRYRPIFQGAKAIIAIGPKVADEISEFSHKVTTILNGIDTDLFCPPAHESKMRKEILYVGRMEEKRVEVLRHLAQVHNQICGTPLKIISDWNPNLPGTEFRPWQVDLLPHLQKSGIVAACGRTAREALSCGNAVVLMQKAYDGTISSQLVTESNFDFSGNLGRFPHTLLQADLQRLLRRSHRLKKLQQWGRNYALAHLSSEQMAKRTALLYREILDCL